MGLRLDVISASVSLNIVEHNGIGWPGGTNSRDLEGHMGRVLNISREAFVARYMSASP